MVEQGEPPRSVRRGDPGTPTSSVALPGGHPEGFIEAFSQLYTDFAERVTARLEKRSPKAAHCLPRMRQRARGSWHSSKRC